MLLFAILIAALAATGAVVAGGALLVRQFFDRTTDTIAAPGEIVSGLAVYGGAQIYDRNGELLYRFPDAAGGLQIPVALDKVSPFLISATVSTEDSGYWTSPGVNLHGTIAAALENFREHGNPLAGRGGSGITQQLVKQTLLDPDKRTQRSAERKLTEAALAIEITRRYSKEDILGWYLNVVNYGGVHNGIESASQGYFGVHASELTLAQAALLAGIPQSPAQYAPYANPAAAKVRQSEVLDLMVRHGDITAEAAVAAKAEELSYRPQAESLPFRAPWFVEYVRQALVERYGEDCLRTCGLSVVTTLDVELEEQAQQLLQANLTQFGDAVGVHNGALVSIDARSGEVLVMLGSRDYNNGEEAIQGQNNFATSSLQPGSSFKPFVYLTLFAKDGYGPSSIIFDSAFVTADGYKCENPRSIGRLLGPVPVKLALGSSLNCPANRAVATAGVDEVIKTAAAIGITTLGDPSQYGPSIATGGANINLIDMAFAYTTLARNGSMIGADVQRPQDGLRALDPAVIRTVTDPHGTVLYQFEPKTTQVIDAAYPYLVNSILSDCQNRRLIWPCGFPSFTLADGRPVAVKTGTQQGTTVTTDTLANWQFMYTPLVVTGGWVGNANRSTWTDVNGGANAVGTSVRQLEQLVIDRYQIPAAEFERPGNVVSVSVRVPDGSRGTVFGCGPTEQGLFVRGSEPDVNNRVCVFGNIKVPAEQLGTGGLTPYVPPAIPTPAPSPSPTATPSASPGPSATPEPPPSPQAPTIVTTPVPDAPVPTPAAAPVNSTGTPTTRYYNIPGRSTGENAAP